MSPHLLLDGQTAEVVNYVYMHYDTPQPTWWHNLSQCTSNGDLGLALVSINLEVEMCCKGSLESNDIWQVLQGFEKGFLQMKRYLLQYQVYGHETEM